MPYLKAIPQQKLDRLSQRAKQCKPGYSLDITYLQADGTGARQTRYSSQTATKKVPLGGPYKCVVSASDEKRELFTSLMGHSSAEKKSVRESHKENAKRMGIILGKKEISTPRRRRNDRDCSAIDITNYNDLCLSGQECYGTSQCYAYQSFDRGI